MCALCGVLLEEHWAEQDGGRRARVFRVKLANRVLDHFGLRLDDWGGRVYVLRDRKGRSVVVANLGVLWVEAERLSRGGRSTRSTRLWCARLADGKLPVALVTGLPRQRQDDADLEPARGTRRWARRR